jgi:hypothetical protein
MDDLEMTKLCAEAMDLPTPEIRGEAVFCGGFTTRGFTGKSEYRSGGMRYNPLHDDAQAMALVKKFGLDIQFFYWNEPEVSKHDAHGKLLCKSQNADLNRAICECVAKLKQGEG